MARLYAAVLGAVFVLVGILGFLGDTKLFGIFEVNTVHNLIHLVSGAVALLAAWRGLGYARLYARVFGAIYALVTILGLVLGGDILGIIHVNAADNALHALIAIATLLVGFAPLSARDTLAAPARS